MNRAARNLAAVLLGGSVAAWGFAAEPANKTPKAELTFEKDIRPIFKAKCFKCHAGAKPKGELNLSRPTALLTGGESGPAVRIGSAETSLLYDSISSGEMPPAKVGPEKRLTAKEKGIIRAWINEGAKGVGNAAAIGGAGSVKRVEHWSFRPPKRPPLPEVGAKGRVANPVDAFILRKLEAKGLTLAPRADRLTLLRRATFGLTGLPPSPTEIKSFLNDKRPDAYARLIDRLLSSPHYGEHWGRHWLDVAGYTDSAGVLFQDLPLPFAYRFRDYVIRAFNSDKPYDQFLREQIAGDELTDYWTAHETRDTLPPNVVEGITATGFLRTAADASRPDFNTIKNAAGQYYWPTIFDTVQIVASSTMGLTLQCARCHSHKFDPVPQEDYYRMASVFMGAYRPTEWIPQSKRRLRSSTKKQQTAADKVNAEVDKATNRLKAEFEDYKKGLLKKVFNLRLAKLSAEIREDVKKAFATPEADRSTLQEYLVKKFQVRLKPPPSAHDRVFKMYFPDYVKKGKALNDKLATEDKRRVHYDEIRALYDLPGSVPSPFLLRGDPLTPGPNVQPGVISTLKTPQPFAWKIPPRDARTSGRRLAFARWLTQPGHPLTARVLVNRVWLHHFGTGIVATPEDFGVAGAAPSHPELLDWLAVEFVKNGWSIKQLHRLILNSATWRQRYRLSADERKIATAADPTNRLLWHQNLRRLPAEPMRDAVLAASGLLDRSLFGAAIAVARQKSGEVIVHQKPKQNRRSIYIQVLRLNPETMLRAFDQPEMSINCTQRSRSTVSTQALTLLNSDSMVRAAEAFAKRASARQPKDPVDFAVLAAFARPATAGERKLFAQFLDEQAARHLAASEPKERAKPEAAGTARQAALADLCHMLLSANEFAYID